MLKHAWCIVALAALWCVATIKAQDQFLLTTWCYDVSTSAAMSCDLRVLNQTSAEQVAVNVTSTTRGATTYHNVGDTTEMMFEASADGYYARNMSFTWSDSASPVQYIFLAKTLLRNEFRAVLYFDAGAFYGSARKLMPLIEPKTDDSLTWGQANEVGGERTGDCNAVDAFKPLCTSPDTTTTRVMQLETIGDPSSVAPVLSMRMQNLAEGRYTFKAVVPPLGTRWADKGIRVELFSGGGLQWGSPGTADTTGLLAEFGVAGAKNNYYKYWAAFTITVDDTGNTTLANTDRYVVSPASVASAPALVLTIVAAALTALLTTSPVSL